MCGKVVNSSAIWKLRLSQAQMRNFAYALKWLYIGKEKPPKE